MFRQAILICLIGFFLTGCGSKEIYVPPQSDSGQQCIHLAKEKSLGCEREVNSTTDRCVRQAELEGLQSYLNAKRSYQWSTENYEDCLREKERSKLTGRSYRACIAPGKTPNRSDFIHDQNCHYAWKLAIKSCKAEHDNLFLACGGKIEREKS